MAELSLLDNLDTETRSRTRRPSRSPPPIWSARSGQPPPQPTPRTAPAVIDAATGAEAEDGKRAELRAACSVGRYLLGAKGNQSGPEAELQQELGLAANQIPLEVFARPETRSEKGELETRVTPAPGTDRHQSRRAETRSVRAERGGPAHGRNADGREPEHMRPERSARRSPRTPWRRAPTCPRRTARSQWQTTSPHRVGASLNLAAEDIAAVGQAEFRVHPAPAHLARAVGRIG